MLILIILFNNFLRELYIGKERNPSQEKIMSELKFKRRFSKSFGNKAATVTVPRVIAQLWQEHSTFDLIFDGNCLVITPTNESMQAQGDQEL
jgi:hypothetical protein